MWNRKNEKNEKMRFLTVKTIFFYGISFVKLREGKTGKKAKGGPFVFFCWKNGLNREKMVLTVRKHLIENKKFFFIQIAKRNFTRKC